MSENRDESGIVDVFLPLSVVYWLIGGKRKEGGGLNDGGLD